eukprot:1177892-Prorocentrum_minimum.AAC.1
MGGASSLSADRCCKQYTLAAVARETRLSSESPNRSRSRRRGCQTRAPDVEDAKPARADAALRKLLADALALPVEEFPPTGNQPHAAVCAPPHALDAPGRLAVVRLPVGLQAKPDPTQPQISSCTVGDTLYASNIVTNSNVLRLEAPNMLLETSNLRVADALHCGDDASNPKTPERWSRRALAATYLTGLPRHVEVATAGDAHVVAVRAAGQNKRHHVDAVSNISTRAAECYATVIVASPALKELKELKKSAQRRRPTVTRCDRSRIAFAVSSRRRNRPRNIGGGSQRVKQGLNGRVASLPAGHGGKAACVVGGAADPAGHGAVEGGRDRLLHRCLPPLPGVGGDVDGALVRHHLGATLVVERGDQQGGAGQAGREGHALPGVAAVGGVVEDGGLTDDVTLLAGERDALEAVVDALILHQRKPTVSKKNQ